MNFKVCQNCSFFQENNDGIVAYLSSFTFYKEDYPNIAQIKNTLKKTLWDGDKIIIFETFLCDDFFPMRPEFDYLDKYITEDTKNEFLEKKFFITYDVGVAEDFIINECFDDFCIPVKINNKGELFINKHEKINSKLKNKILSAIKKFERRFSFSSEDCELFFEHTVMTEEENVL